MGEIAKSGGVLRSLGEDYDSHRAASIAEANGFRLTPSAGRVQVGDMGIGAGAFHELPMCYPEHF